MLTRWRLGVSSAAATLSAAILSAATLAAAALAVTATPFTATALALAATWYAGRLLDVQLRGLLGPHQRAAENAMHLLHDIWCVHNVRPDPLLLVRSRHIYWES